VTWRTILRPAAPLPKPLSPRREGISTDRAGAAGRGRTTLLPIPRAEVASLPLPWATFPDPFRAENWLAARLSGTPCVQPKRMWDMLSNGREGVKSSFFPWPPFLGERGRVRGTIEFLHTFRRPETTGKVPDWTAISETRHSISRFHSVNSLTSSFAS
jgi:hypothetical protein